MQAVVARSGRIDLVPDAITKLKVPTLLVVGQHDQVVRNLNEEALLNMTGPKVLVEVPEATHLFEEPGALELVARLAGVWFTKYLCNNE